MKRKGVLCIALLLTAAALGLFGAGLWLAKPWSSRPRVAAFSGEVLLGEKPAEIGRVIDVGAVLRVKAADGSVTITYEDDGTILTLSGKTRLVYLGRSNRARCFTLTRGEVRVKAPEESAALRIESELGTVSAKGATFELFAAPMPVGAAIDTPRVLRLVVGAGWARFRVAGEGGAAETIPAGVAARIMEGQSRVLLGSRRGSGGKRQDGLFAVEWQRMIGRVPQFANAELPAGEVPPGVWVPRRPGRNGAVPGSRTRVKMLYVPLLGGVLSADGGSDEGSWCYDARRDSWKRQDPPAVRVEETAGRKPPSLPSDCRAAPVAHSPKANAFLLYGRVGEGAETWVYRNAEKRWRRLSPRANPPPRTRHALYYDPSADLFVLYGGDAGGRAYDDVWVFRLASGKW